MKYNFLFRAGTPAKIPSAFLEVKICILNPPQLVDVCGSAAPMRVPAP